MAVPPLATPTPRAKRAQKTRPATRQEVVHVPLNVTQVLDEWEEYAERALQKSAADKDGATWRVMEGTRDALFLMRERLSANISEDAVFALTANNKSVESIALVTTRHATRGTKYVEQVYIGEAVASPGADEKKNALSDLMFRIRNWADVPPGSKFMDVPPGLLLTEYFETLDFDSKDPMPDPLYGMDLRMVELTG